MSWNHKLFKNASETLVKKVLNNCKTYHSVWMWWQCNDDKKDYMWQICEFGVREDSVYCNLRSGTRKRLGN